jgi:hypothetical protein
VAEAGGHKGHVLPQPAWSRGSAPPLQSHVNTCFQYYNRNGILSEAKILAGHTNNKIYIIQTEEWVWLKETVAIMDYNSARGKTVASAPPPQFLTSFSAYAHSLCYGMQLQGVHVAPTTFT